MSNKNDGFTIIELLTVIMIVGILAAIGVPQYFKALEKSKVATGIKMINDIHKAMAAAHAMDDEFPTTLNSAKLDLNYTEKTATYIRGKYFDTYLVGGTTTSYTADARRRAPYPSRYGFYNFYSRSSDTSALAFYMCNSVVVTGGSVCDELL